MQKDIEILKEAYLYKGFRIRINRIAQEKLCVVIRCHVGKCKSQAGFIVLTEHMLRTRRVETMNLENVVPICPSG